MKLIRPVALILTAWIAVFMLSGCGGTETAIAPVEATPAAAPAASAPEPIEVGEPSGVRIPALGVDQGLSGIGLEPNGAMTTPAFGEIGWYDRGPTPGSTGPAVIVAHVHGPAGDDVFAKLHELEPGDLVTVTHDQGESTFAVTGMESVEKEALPYDRIWNKVDRPVLRLITCGGTPDPVTRMYPLNTIVYAEPVL